MEGDFPKVRGLRLPVGEYAVFGRGRRVRAKYVRESAARPPGSKVALKYPAMDGAGCGRNNGWSRRRREGSVRPVGGVFVFKNALGRAVEEHLAKV
ncbi:MAG: hypothetical protein ACR2N0_16570 [Rubrobacteraceae bacterium]